MVRPWVYIAAGLTLAAAAPAAAQPRAYAGGAFALHTQTHGDRPIGGTGPDGSALFGVWLSPRVAVEVEPVFGPGFSSEYSYRPGPSLVANVVASRRDTFLAFQVRTRIGPLQPVAGAGYVHSRATRHATFATRQTYFDDESSDDGMFVGAGVDAPFRVAPHVELFPTFRLLLTMRDTPADLILSQTATGSVTLRFGAGARILF